MEEGKIIEGAAKNVSVWEIVLAILTAGFVGCYLYWFQQRANDFFGLIYLVFGLPVNWIYGLFLTFTRAPVRIKIIYFLVCAVVYLGVVFNSEIQAQKLFLIISGAPLAVAGIFGWVFVKKNKNE